MPDPTRRSSDRPRFAGRRRRGVRGVDQDNSAPHLGRDSEGILILGRPPRSLATLATAVCWIVALAIVDEQASSVAYHLGLLHELCGKRLTAEVRVVGCLVLVGAAHAEATVEPAVVVVPIDPSRGRVLDVRDRLERAVGRSWCRAGAGRPRRWRERTSFRMLAEPIRSVWSAISTTSGGGQGTRLDGAGMLLRE